MSSSRKTDSPATAPDKASVVPLRPGRERARPTAARPNVVTLRAKTHCIQCTLREHCLPAGLEAEDLWEFDELFEGQRRLRKGDMLLHAGGTFVALYAIRVGSLKISILAEDGREQVAGYQMAGEIIGLDGIATGCHTCNAAALEDSEVCAVPFDRLEQMAQANPVIRNSVRQLLAAEVRRNHGHMLLLGSMRAEERVASFLLNLAERYRRRGYSGSEFVLRMTREEIGSYLGLKLETVSRVFSRLQADGLIQAQGRDVKLLDPPQLNHLVGREVPPSGL